MRQALEISGWMERRLALVITLDWGTRANLRVQASPRFSSVTGLFLLKAHPRQTDQAGAGKDHSLAPAPSPADGRIATEIRMLCELRSFKKHVRILPEETPVRDCGEGAGEV